MHRGCDKSFSFSLSYLKLKVTLIQLEYIKYILSYIKQWFVQEVWKSETELETFSPKHRDGIFVFPDQLFNMDMISQLEKIWGIIFCPKYRLLFIYNLFYNKQMSAIGTIALLKNT